jgi:hypothetical protein
LEDRQPLFQRTFGQVVRMDAYGLLAGGDPVVTYFSLYRLRKVSKRKPTPLSASRSRAAGNLSCRSKARKSQASSAVSHAVMRRQIAQGAVGKEAQMFEPVGRVSAAPAGPEQRSVPEAKRRVDESGSPTLCSLSLGEARESDSPAGARPRLPLQPMSQTNISTWTSPTSATTGNSSEDPFDAEH